MQTTSNGSAFGYSLQRHYAQQQCKPNSGGKSFTIEALLAKPDPDNERERASPLPYAAASSSASFSLTYSPSPYNPLPPVSYYCSCPPFSYQAACRGAFYAPVASMAKAHALKGKGAKSKRMRTSFTSEQLARLEKEFARQQYMVGSERFLLASSLQLTEAQVKVWFQNRRIKWRKQSLEQQQAKLAKLGLTGASAADPPKSPGSQGHQDEDQEFSDSDVDVDAEPC